MIDQEESLPEEIVAQLESVKSSYKIYMVVGDLNLLHKGGRLSTVKYTMGQLAESQTNLNGKGDWFN